VSLSDINTVIQTWPELVCFSQPRPGFTSRAGHVRLAGDSGSGTGFIQVHRFPSSYILRVPFSFIYHTKAG